MEEEDNNDYINFRVDSGLIDRLGRELVGKSETAVSELIKNSYDADATSVNVTFINTNVVGGSLKIIDNGLGMTREELEKGFMTISSSDKIHNPKSVRYNRNKAGRKGIGRFATQRLGTELIIITQKKESTTALKITINWNDYKIDTNLVDIKNLVEETDKTEEEGTELIINHLREAWSENEIKRVYRYVSDLLQPDYLSDRSKDLKIAKQKDESFKVNFRERINNGHTRIIADPNKMLFNKAIAIVEGWIDSNNDGHCKVTSESLDLIDSESIKILHEKVIGEKEIIVKKKIIKEPILENKYLNLKNVHFKVYYFIYNREAYYANVSKIELKSIQNIASEQSGIKLYRNGFRVLPYGEKNNDWLSIDRRYYDESGAANIPFGNHNFFGFVEIIDSDGDLFEETASREGLLENEAYNELKDFVHKALEGGRIRIRYGIKKKRDELNPKPDTFYSSDNTKSPIEKLEDLQTNINNLVDGKGNEQQDKTYRDNIQQYVSELKFDFQNLIDELGMTRVLAGLGLTIGEFTHEVVQFSPSMNGDLSVLSQQELDPTGLESLENLTRTIKLFTSYTSYFNATVSANVSRELKAQKVDEIVTNFRKIIEADLSNLDINFEIELFGFDLITIPMHSSEWSSILFNLYTNSKKAIRRANSKGMIKIIVGKENNNVYLEFLDNGDGIPESNANKIFDAFFTTSSPLGFESTQDERLTGTGLGLKIIKDIITTYRGSIELIQPETNYNTCFRIEIPLASEKQKKEYGL